MASATLPDGTADRTTPRPSPRLGDSPAYRRLMLILAQCDQLERDARVFLNAHKSGCGCRFCDWMDSEGGGVFEGQAALLEDVRALAYALRTALAQIRGLMPPS